MRTTRPYDGLMELTTFCSNSRVVVVAGKGGVGKTTVTAALATAAARAGLSVLVVEVEGKSGLASMFGRPPLTYEEAELARGVRARTLTPDEALTDYLQGAGLKRISKRLTESGALDVVAGAVPGMKDILVLGKVKQLERAGAADLVIVDGPAAGHAIGFLLSPLGLIDAVRVGPIRKQAEDVIEMLADPSRCQVLLTTMPEETPVNELVETAFHLEDRVGVALAPVVVNGFYPDLPIPETIDAAGVQNEAALVDVFVSEREAGDLARAAEFRMTRRRLQQAQVERLARMLPLPQIRLPFLFASEIDRDGVERLAEAFTAGVAELEAA